MKWIIRKIAIVLLALVISIANINFVIAGSQMSDEQQNHLGEVTNGEIDLLGIVDIQSPELKDIRLSSDKIEVPGSIEVEVSATDDISGVSEGFLGFSDSISGKLIRISLSNKVWNKEKEEYENLPNGILKGQIEFDNHQKPCVYELVDVKIVDRAGNVQRYIKNISDLILGSELKELLITKTITVDNSYELDIIPPELIEIYLSNHIIQAPGIIEAEVLTSDDISGISEGWIKFRDILTEKEIMLYLRNKSWDEDTNDDENLPDGILKGVLELNQYHAPGKYELHEVRIEDRSGNMQFYVSDASDWQLENGYKELEMENTITVTNCYELDLIPPVLNDVILIDDTIEVPGIIEAVISARDDISGALYGRLVFKNTNTQKRITVSLSNEVWDKEAGNYNNLPDGILMGSVELSHYQYPGEYELVEAWIEDRAENMQQYKKDADGWELNNGFKELEINNKIFIINSGQNYELSTNTNNPNLSEDIKNILSPPESEPSVKIGINYETGSLLSGEVFKSIAGENKEIILEGGSIQWIFNGKDIDQNNIKEIDLGVNISRLDNSFSGSYDDITDIVKEQPTYVLSFADNGVLPGKATIRLKADYAFIDHLGRNDLCVYYYDSKNDKLVNIKSNIDVSNDGFIEFSIYHNSDFIITKGEVPYRTSGSTESSSGNKKREKPISAENAINSLKQKEKDIIVNNFKEALPYTSLIPELTIVQLKELTNNIFTEAQLKEIHKNMNLLQELGIDYSVYKSSYVELKPVENILFSDVPEIHWANEVIKEAGKLGIIAGMPEGTFLPNENLKVADAFSFLDRILLINGINEAKQNRSLVEKYINNKENWAFHSVASISSKLEENTIKEVSFIGEDYLSRELLAQVIYETTSGLFPELKNEANFTDLGNSPYKNAIEYCVSQEILKGTGIDKMEPAKPVTRAEMIAIIVRINNKFKDIK